MIVRSKTEAAVASNTQMAGFEKKKNGGDCSPPSLDAFRPEALLALRLAFLVGRRQRRRPDVDVALLRGRGVRHLRSPTISRQRRSEERRVGKECRSRWSPYH